MGGHTVGVEQRVEWTSGEEPSRVSPTLASEDLREGTCDETSSGGAVGGLLCRP